MACMSAEFRGRTSLYIAAALGLSCLLAAGCASAPSDQPATTPPSQSDASRSTPGDTGQIAPTTATRRAIAAAALEQLGVAYRADAAGPTAFDNSGLTYFAYRRSGTALPRDVQAQLQAGKPVELAQAQPADLVFFRAETRNGRDRLLVGLYTRPGEVLMASPGVRGHVNAGVKRLDIDNDDYWSQRQVGVIRVIPR